MTNPLWVWMIEQDQSAYWTNDAFGGPSSKEAGPLWTFDRYGQTETTLPDGRLVRIGGEHEDWYDPDFYIYNDVVVSDAGGNTEIFGYSEDAFPPTDFHTADLIGDRIIIIGNLSYPALRKDKAQVLSLDADRYSVDRVEVAGEGPSWLFKHSSELVDDDGAILVRGGLIVDQRWPGVIENIDDWRLDIRTFHWIRLTKRAWPRFAFVRADGEPNHLFWLRSLCRARARKKPDQQNGFRAERLRDLGPNPRLDLLETLYSPAISHSPLPKGDQTYIRRVSIEGVCVRYTERDHMVSMTVEGSLPAQTVERLRAELHEKLASIENGRIECMPIIVD